MTKTVNIFKQITPIIKKEIKDDPESKMAYRNGKLRDTIKVRRRKAAGLMEEEINEDISKTEDEGIGSDVEGNDEDDRSILS